MQRSPAHSFSQSLLLRIAERLPGIHPDDPLNGCRSDRAIVRGPSRASRRLCIGFVNGLRVDVVSG